MEAAGLAIGVPGLFALLLQTSIQGYQTLSNIRHADDDLNDRIRGINVEYQAFSDWQKNTGVIMERLKHPEEQHRFRIVIATLVRVANVFTELATMESKRGRKEPESTGSTTIGKKKSRVSRPSWLHFRSSSRSSGGKTTGSASSSSASLFDIGRLADDINQRIELEKILPLATEMERSVSTLPAVRWALIDGERMKELHLKLREYNEDLRKSTKQLLGLNAQLTQQPMGQLFMVPFPRNSSFVGRKDVLLQIDQLLKFRDGQQTRAALWGLGGTGKTSIAVEYCHTIRTKDLSAAINIFWIHGNSEATFKASYQEIAKMASIPVTGTEEEKDMHAVKRWLEDSKSNWMLVVDNVDDLSVDFKYLPVINGVILFTTRDNRIVGDPSFGVPSSNGVGIDCMTRPEAEALLNTDIRAPASAEICGELCELLGDLPLAIAQAAAYMRSTHISLSTYINLFRKSGDLKQKLLDKPVSAYTREDQTARTVMTTWQVTVDQIEVKDPLAIDILRFMSLLDPEQIPLEIIRASPKFKDIDELRFTECMGLFLSFALITVAGPDSYRLHRLVSLWTTRSMLEEEKQILIDMASHALLQCFPDDIISNLSKCTQLTPHSEAVLQHANELNASIDSALSLQSTLGSSMREQGRYNHALKLFQGVLASREQTLRKDDPVVLEAVHNLALVFEAQGQYDKALDWYQRALNGWEKTLGKDHPDTLRTINNMAVVFNTQGQHDKALDWYQRALNGWEKTLGKDHTETLRTINNMAIVFEAQGQHDKALDWYQRALNSREKTLGKDHPDTLRTINNMAVVFKAQGQHNKALDWYQRALNSREKTLGKDHPDTLRTISNMAIVFKAQGQHDKALDWYQRALNGREKALGKDHPDTLRTISNMAKVFEAQGQHDKALDWYQRALNGREKTLGKDHPDTVMVAKYVARLLAEAEQAEWSSTAPSRSCPL